MFSLFSKKGVLKEVKIAKSSENLVVLPCILVVCKKGLEKETYSIIGYVNYGNLRKFIYLERTHDKIALSAKSVRVPMDASELLIEKGYASKYDFEYVLQKL